MLNAGIHGLFTTACMPASPTVNCAGPTAPKSVGQAIHSESTKTAIVVASVIQRISSSRALGMTGSAITAATRAGRKTISDRGQRAGWAIVSAGDIGKSVWGSGWIE